MNIQTHFLFVSNFEHVNFAINKKYFKKIMTIQKIYVSFVIFQAYKNVILMNVHSLW